MRRRRCRWAVGGGFWSPTLDPNCPVSCRHAKASPCREWVVCGWRENCRRESRNLRYVSSILQPIWLNLFMLVSALMGLDTMQAAYRHAIASGYRFYSYGDGSLLLP